MRVPGHPSWIIRSLLTKGERLIEPDYLRETFLMYAEPMILPLDPNGRIYALQDEKGNTIGTGTREVCEVLLYIITKPASQSISGRINVSSAQRPNVRAAIAI
jgi:hypothetical protein